MLSFTLPLRFARYAVALQNAQWYTNYGVRIPLHSDTALTVGASFNAGGNGVVGHAALAIKGGAQVPVIFKRGKGGDEFLPGESNDVETVGGTLGCSEALEASAVAYCHRSTPVVTYYGVGGNPTRRMKVDTILMKPVYAPVEGDARYALDLSDLVAPMTDASKIARRANAWRQFVSLVTVQPAAVNPLLRDLDGVLAAIQQSLLGLRLLEERGLWHRDIKTENIMLDTIDGTARIIDFGAWRSSLGIHYFRHDSPTTCPAGEICRVVATRNDLTAHGGTQGFDAKYACDNTIRHLAAGTPVNRAPSAILVSHGTAPKRALTQAEVTRADTFALGGVLLKLLTGRIAAFCILPLTRGKYDNSPDAAANMMNLALLDFIQSAPSDDIALSRLLSIIRIGGGMPASLIQADSKYEKLIAGQLLWDRSPLNALVDGLVQPPAPGPVPAGGVRCIPFRTTKGSLYVSPIRGSLDKLTSAADLDAFVSHALCKKAVNPGMNCVPLVLTTAGWWKADAKLVGGGACLATGFTGAPAGATGLSDDAIDATVAHTNAGRPAVALRAILQLLREMLAKPPAQPVTPASDPNAPAPGALLRGLDALAQAARRAVAAIDPVVGAAATARLQAEEDCETECKATVKRLHDAPLGLAALSEADLLRSPICSGNPSTQVSCKRTLRETVRSGFLKHLGKHESVGYSEATTTAMCRRAVCGTVISVPIRPTTTTAPIAKAPLSNGVGTYSAYDFHVRCGSGANAPKVISWKALPAWATVKGAGTDSSSISMAGGAAVASGAGTACTCPKDGASSVASCICVPVTNGGKTSQLVLRGTSLEFFNEAVLDFSCAARPRSCCCSASAPRCRGSNRNLGAMITAL